MPVTYTTKQGQMVDSICQEHYGRTREVTEMVLAANDGLAELGPVLPMGTNLTLPDAPRVAQGTKLVNLWD